MITISSCRINGVAVLGVQVRAGGVSADVGFLIDNQPFGQADFSGLDAEVEVRDAAQALQTAIEAVIGRRLGTSDTPASQRPIGLLDPKL